jgi:hypothetical protein|eukprot:evm.model.NODE_28528_length_50078_cov_28.909842.5
MEKGVPLVKTLDADEERALIKAAATAALLAAKANAKARGKPNSIHAKMESSTSAWWRECGRQTNLPARMPWSHEGWNREEGTGCGME